MDNEQELRRAPDEQPEEEKNAAKRDPLYSIYSLLHDFVYILAAITLVFVFCVRLVGVNGDSMLPTLHNGDYLALQSNVIMGQLKPGDIIVARKLTFEDGEPIVKRVIATEGQTVDIRYDGNERGTVYVDGEPIDEPYIREAMRPLYGGSNATPLPLTVEKGCIFVMGDNRNNSSDSRRVEIGQIRLDQVLGKVLMIVFPGADPVTRERDFSRFGAVS